MKSVGLPLVTTVFLLALGSLFFRPSPPQAQPVLAASPNHPQEVFTATSSALTIIDAFQQAGVAYYPEDKTTAFPEPSLGLGSVITVERALPVEVIDGKRTYQLRTWQETVGSLLREKKIELGAEDRVAPTPETRLGVGMKVTITRVARTNVSEKEVIAYQTVIEKDYNQFVGAQTVVEKGQNGEREKIYLVIREDGELISKTLVSSKVTTPPRTARVKQGGLNPVSAKCLPYKDMVVDASRKNGIDPNALFYRMQKESNCNPNSQAAAGYQGILQYDPGLWPKLSSAAGYGGKSIWDARSQIYVTAWAWANGHRSRWPNP